jgi:hypothetical protein
MTLNDLDKTKESMTLLFTKVGQKAMIPSTLASVENMA